MTRELYEKLIPYEEKLHTAFYSDFVRLTDPRMKEELAKLHNEAFGHNGNILGGCNRCVINALKNLGREYFKAKKVYEAEEVHKEPEPTIEVVENQTVEQPKEKKATNKTKKATKK